MKHPVHHRRNSSRAPEPAAATSTRDEVAQARSVLDALIAFLEATRRSLDGIPTSKSGRSVATSAQMLDALLENAKSNLALTPPPRIAPRKARRAVHSTKAEVRARELCDQINAEL